MSETAIMAALVAAVVVGVVLALGVLAAAALLDDGEG